MSFDQYKEQLTIIAMSYGIGDKVDLLINTIRIHYSAFLDGVISMSEVKRRLACDIGTVSRKFGGRKNCVEEIVELAYAATRRPSEQDWI